MSLLLTRNCHYAILVAVEDGQHFTSQEDKDIYITARLNLKLPRPVDDLIPPTTLISTKPTVMTDKPQWRTTLVYYVSSRILQRLRKRQSTITLDVLTMSEAGVREKVGSMVLNLDQAKRVLTRGDKRDIAQIQQFVVDKGDWIPITEHNKTRVKTGLFIVEMPNNTDTSDKAVATPLQMPMRTKAVAVPELGLEICSDVSELLIDTTDRNDEDSLLLDDDEDEEDFEQDIMHIEQEEEQEEEEETEDVIAIGDGTDQYTFQFKIFDAKYISSITNQFPQQDDIDAFFQYEFADRQFTCRAEYTVDEWKALEHHIGLSFQGSLDDIIAWLDEQALITVCLVVQDARSGKQEIIAFSEVYLKGRDINVVKQSSLIYDTERVWHVNADKQFSKLQLEIGLVKGWEDEEEYSQSVFQ